MTSSQVLSIYINKLNHPISEIRVRSLKLLTAKLGLGWELEDELSCTRELIEAMLNWFRNPQPSLQTEALELLLRTIKTKAGTYIAKELGVRRLIANLDQIKHKLTEPSSLEVYEDIVETLRFLNTVESEDNVAIPRLDLPSTASSDSDQINGYYNIDTNIQFSNETSISSEEIEIKNILLSKISDSIKIVLFPWVELSPSDSKTMLLIEDALKLLKSVRRCCRFIRDVFLRDFPAEIFLNRPAIIKNLLAIASGNHGNRPGEALQVLLNITRALHKRLLELCCIDLIHESNKLPDDPIEVVDQTNIELEQMTESVDLDRECEDGLAALRQLPAPIYSLDALHAILSTMARSLVAVDSAKSELLNLKELNICVELTDSLIDLLLACVSDDFWSVEHSTKTHRDVAHKSCVLMRLVGDVLNRLQQSYSENSEKYHHRAVWLRLVSCAERLMHWARSSALPPAALVAALQRASLDPALQLLHPRCSERVTLALQTSKTSVDHEYKTKYRELSKLTSAMDDAVLFMKNKNSCRNSKNVFRIIKKSLPVLELHMSETFLNDVADILLKKTKDFDMDDSDWEVARSIALNLMTHNVEWIRAKFYSLVVEMVRFVLVGDEENQAENEKCLTLLCDVSVLTEICCHGLSSKTKPVEASANEIILYLLRGRMVLSESCWWRLLASLLPVLPLLHVYAEHDTLLGKAICKSLTHDIASCMGVSLSEVVGGLTRLLFVRCVAVQLDAAHSLCQLLDDERYLPPKEALRADVLLNALKRVQPQEFNIDQNSSPSKTPQTTGLLQLLDVLKQDIMLDEHGTEYVSSPRFVQPTLEPMLRRSTLQQLAAMLRQQELHAALLQSDGLRVCVATLRMSLMVDDYLAYPECAISCVSILNSVCFASRHSLAKIPDLPSLLIRVILVFPANDSAVCMAAQVLSLLAWSGFALQELDSNRRRVPALPACVAQRTVLPFSVNAYWTSSPNAEHSSIEWMTLDEHWVRLVRVRWWCAYCGRQRVLCGAPPPPAPLTLRPTERDRALLRDSCPVHSSAAALLDLENATSHSQVSDALCLLESYAHLLPPATLSCEEYSALPWQHMRRFLCAPPASSRDAQLLTALMGFILTYMDVVAGRGGTTSWIKDTFIGTDTAIISLLSRDQLLPQQTAQESIEVTQLHISIVKVLLRCVKQLEYEDYDSSKLESLLKILLACLGRIDLKNFHALGYLNELLRCIRYVLHSRYCQLSEDTLVHSFKVIASTLSGCAAGGGRKGQSCRLDAILTLLALLHQAQRERIPVQRWCEAWNTTAVDAVSECVSAASPTLRAAALKTIAALAHYAQLRPHLQQAIQEESLSQCGAQILAERSEAAVVRAGAADLLTAVTARVSAHSDVLECDVLGQFKANNTVDVCIEILVDFCNGKNYETTFEPNVPLSVLERRSELEVRAQKCGDVRVCPSLAGRGRVPPTAPLVATVADMLHNVSAFARAPVQAWNEKGLYRLLFRCASSSIGTKADIEGVRGAACRALVAATSHKCVRNTLAATKDCLHNLLLTLKPLQEDDMGPSCIHARAQALLLLACLLAERAAADSVWGDLKDRHPTTFFSCLLQCLDTDEIDLQAAALHCLTQLSQSIVHKKQSDKAPDPSRVQLFESLKSPYMPSESNDRLGMGDSARRDCHPEYMAEEMCGVLIEMYRKISLDNMKYQCSEDDFWTRVCACLSSLLTASGRVRSFAVHRGLPKILLGSLQAVRDHLSVLGKPVETLKNANHNPTLRILYWLLTVMNSSMVECPVAKESFAEDGIAVSLNRLWPWCMMTDQLRLAVLGLLYNFTNDCPKAWSSMSTCVGSRNLTLEVCSLIGREAALQSRTRPAALLLLCAHAARHAAPHHQCRALVIKNDVISILYKSIIRDRHGVSSIGAAWARLCCALSRYPEGGAALLALRPRLPALPAALRPRLLPALAHAAHHQRESVLHDPDLLELLSGSLLAGDTQEMVAAAHAVWALAANNHKAKLLLRSAGVAASVQAGVQRLQRARDADAQRAAQLLTYTHTVLQTS